MKTRLKKLGALLFAMLLLLNSVGPTALANERDGAKPGQQCGFIHMEKTVAHGYKLPVAPASLDKGNRMKADMSDFTSRSSVYNNIYTYDGIATFALKFMIPEVSVSMMSGSIKVKDTFHEDLEIGDYIVVDKYGYAYPEFIDDISVSGQTLTLDLTEDTKDIWENMEMAVLVSARIKDEVRGDYHKSTFIENAFNVEGRNGDLIFESNIAELNIGSISYGSYYSSIYKGVTNDPKSVTDDIDYELKVVLDEIDKSHLEAGNILHIYDSAPSGYSMKDGSDDYKVYIHNKTTGEKDNVKNNNKFSIDADIDGISIKVPLEYLASQGWSTNSKNYDIVVELTMTPDLQSIESKPDGKSVTNTLTVSAEDKNGSRLIYGTYNRKSEFDGLGRGSRVSKGSGSRKEHGKWDFSVRMDIGNSSDALAYLEYLNTIEGDEIFKIVDEMQETLTLKNPRLRIGTDIYDLEIVSDYASNYLREHELVLKDGFGLANGGLDATKLHGKTIYFEYEVEFDYTSESDLESMLIGVNGVREVKDGLLEFRNKVYVDLADERLGDSTSWTKLTENSFSNTAVGHNISGKYTSGPVEYKIVVDYKDELPIFYMRDNFINASSNPKVTAKRNGVTIPNPTFVSGDQGAKYFDYDFAASGLGKYEFIITDEVDTIACNMYVNNEAIIWARTSGQSYKMNPKDSDGFEYYIEKSITINNNTSEDRSVKVNWGTHSQETTGTTELIPAATSKTFNPASNGKYSPGHNASLNSTSGAEMKLVKDSCEELIYVIEEKASEPEKPPKDEVILEVKKVWKDTDESNRPESIDVEITGSGSMDKTITLSKANDWRYTERTEIDGSASNDPIINARAEEISVDGYYPTYKYSNISGTGTNHDGQSYDTMRREITITNETDSYTSLPRVEACYEEDKVSVQVIKAWMNHPFGEEYPEVEMQVLRNGEPFDSVILRDGEIMHRFEDLEMYDENGDEYVFTVEEVSEIPSYKTSYLDVDWDEESRTYFFTVVNTYMPEGEITVTKVWEGGESLKEDIRVQLYQDGKEFGEPVTIEKDKGSYTFKDVPLADEDGNEYKYTVKELTQVPNFEPIVDGLTIINKYTSPKQDLTVEKVWVDGPERRPTIEIQLYRDGEPHLSSVRLPNGRTEYTFTGLDVTDEDGKTYVYTVDELNVPEGYEKDVNGTTEDVQWIRFMSLETGEVMEEMPMETFDAMGIRLSKYVADNNYSYQTYIKYFDGTFTITNTYIQPKVDIDIEKVWIGGPKDKPEIEVQLYRNGEEHLDPVKLDSSNEAKPVIPMLNIFAKRNSNDPVVWEYRFEDLDKTDGNGNEYQYTIKEVNTPENYTSEVDGYTITNTYNSPTDSLEFTKVWVDGEEARDFIKVQLYRNGEEHGEVVTLSPETTSYVFEDLELTDANGKDYVYTIDEVELPENFTKEVDGMTITNTYESPKTDVEITKVWEGGPSERPDIDIQLYRNGEKFLDPVTLSNGKTTHVYKDLDATDSTGKAYKFTVDEVNVPAGYIKDIDGLTIINTYESAKREITVTKVWANGPETKEDIDVQLYRDGEALGKAVTLKNGETTYTWTELDVTDANGVPYKYSVDELNTPENYDKSVDGYTITNTYVSPTDDVEMTKVWVDGPEAKEDIKIQLYRNGESYGELVTLKDGETSYTWKDLDVTDENGVDYIYTVDEFQVPANYVKSVDGLVITNTYESSKTQIEVIKKWVNGSEDRPTVEIQLYRNGEALGDVVELENGKDRYVFQDLDVTDENGNEYTYTVDEVNVPENYEKSVDGFIITNTFVSPTKDVVINKVWIGGPDKDKDVEMQLFRNGEEYLESVTLTKDGGYTHTYKDLDVYDENGKEYSYSVDEISEYKNYAKTYSEDKLTVMNTYESPHGDIVVRKVWVDAPEEKPTIEIQLVRDGEDYLESVELEDGETEYVFVGLELTDENGKEYTFTVREVEVPEHYTSEVDGLTITNTYEKPEEPEIPEEPEVEEPEVPEEPEEPEVEEGESSDSKKPVDVQTSAISGGLALMVAGGLAVLLSSGALYFVKRKED